MQDLPGGAMYLAVILLVGYTTLCWVLKSRQRHWLELAGLSFSCGAGVVSLLLFYVSLAGKTPSRWTLITAAVAAIALLLVRIRQVGPLRPSVPARISKPGALTLLGALAVMVILVSVSAVSTRAGWPVMENIDAFAIWVLKAKWIAVKPLLPMPPEFHDPALSFSHQDYPLAFPFLVAGLFTMVGRLEDPPSKYLMLPIYIAILAVMYGAVRRHHRRAIALALTALLAASPNLTGSAGSPIPELLLILFYASALSLILSWTENGNSDELLLAGLFIASLAFTKNEGLALMPILGIASLCYTLVGKRPGTLRQWARAAALSLIVILPWLIYRMFLPRTHEDYGTKLTNLPMILHNLPRASYVVRAYLGNLVQMTRVGPIWCLLVAIVVICPTGIRRPPLRLLWSLLIIQIGIYLGAFLVTPWDVHLLVPMVTPRLLSQTGPLVVLIISMHLRELRQNNNE